MNYMFAINTYSGDFFIWPTTCSGHQATWM